MKKGFTYYVWLVIMDHRKLWADILFWLLPSAFVWLTLLNVDGALFTPFIIGALPVIISYTIISLYRMKFAVFTR